MLAASLIAAQQEFTTHLPAVEKAVRWLFRKRRRFLRRDEYEEILAEALGAAWSAWVGLLSRGKDPVQVGVHAIATNAVRYVRNGRKIANRSGGRGAMSVDHKKAQAAGGFKVKNFDSSAGPGGESSRWGDWVFTDNRCTPADLAAFKIDYSEWTARLPDRRRRIALLLADGHSTSDVAKDKEVNISEAAVSQTRIWLRRNWERFQGDRSASSRSSCRTVPATA